jgi:hypothetical protein
MRRTLAGTLVVAFLALGGAVGCGSSGGGTPAIASTPLAGKVGGQSWTLGTAETDAFLSNSSTFFVSMYSDSFTACSGSSTSADSFVPIIPVAPGDYSLGEQMFTATFSVNNTGIIATSGHLVIDTVTATTITGGIYASANGDNTVNGQFTATICQ